MSQCPLGYAFDNGGGRAQTSSTLSAPQPFGQRFNAIRYRKLAQTDVRPSVLVSSCAFFAVANSPERGSGSLKVRVRIGEGDFDSCVIQPGPSFHRGEDFVAAAAESNGPRALSTK